MSLAICHARRSSKKCLTKKPQCGQSVAFLIAMGAPRGSSQLFDAIILRNEIKSESWKTISERASRGGAANIHTARSSAVSIYTHAAQISRLGAFTTLYFTKLTRSAYFMEAIRYPVRGESLGGETVVE